MVDIHPEQATVTRNRYGYKVDGEFFRRVSTHLRGIPKPWLGRWAAKMVAQAAVEEKEKWEALDAEDAVKLLKGKPWDKRDEAGDRGSAIHHTIEAFVNDESLPDDLTEDEEACALAAMEFLESFVVQALASELTVFNPEHEYAGTLDLWCVDQEGTRWILDWKTGKSVYAEHAVQQIAYRRAPYAIFEKQAVGPDDKEAWEGRVIPWGPGRAERVGIVHVTPEGATLYEIDLAHEDRLWAVFRAAKHLKAFQSDTDDYYSEPKVALYKEPQTFGEQEDSDDGEEE